MYLSLTTDVAILLFLWGSYFLPACLFSLRITHVIKRCSAYPLTLDLRIWWWSIAYVGCRKCWTASQRKGFQCFKLTGKCLFFGPLSLSFLPDTPPPLSAVMSVNLFVASTPGLSLDSAPPGPSVQLSTGFQGTSCRSSIECLLATSRMVT